MAEILRLPVEVGSLSHLGCDIGGAKELGVIYFPINSGAKEPQNLPNHRVAIIYEVLYIPGG